LKLVVDEKERIENPDPNHIYSTLRREHQDALDTAALPQGVTVGTGASHDRMCMHAIAVAAYAQVDVRTCCSMLLD
jgi:hypothetical protein